MATTMLWQHKGLFYEFEGESALIAAKVCGLSVTWRGGIPKTGIPDGPDRLAVQYVARFVAAGYRPCESINARPFHGQTTERG